MSPTASGQASDEPSFDEVFEIFQRVCDLPARERGSALESECGGNDALRREVEAVLAEDGTEGTSFDDLAARTAAGLANELIPAPPPKHIGGFELGRKLGEGGMGVVYEARQDVPRRSVALKLIRAGLVTGGQLRRFQNEAEVLGSLNHPGIAQVYEAGTAETPTGVQPYIAMELVEGERLDRYARRTSLGIDGILSLVADLADAVEHAHQRGVVHRDLKPANVLVTADGRPKILDFGVARVTGERRQGTAHTRTGQLIGTLAYMSPEQVLSTPSEVDARTDVYALGVMAYELLSGERPYDVDSQSLPEAARTIAEDEPTGLGRFDRRLAGDVEVIVANAIAKEKERRYASAADLASDIRRYLATQPILARPASRAYLLRKFARRNKAIVAGLTTAFVAMAVGTGVAVWKAGDADRARVEANRSADVAAAESYRATIMAAQLALQLGDAGVVRDLLESVSEGARGWEWRYLVARLDASRARLDDESVRGATFASDGSGIVTVSEDGKVTWWDHELDAPLRTVDLNVEGIHLPRFVEGADRLVAGFGGGSALGIWDLGTGERLAEALLEHRIGSLTASPGGDRAGAVCGRGRVVLWSPPAAPRVVLLPQATRIAFARDSDAVYLAHATGLIAKRDGTAGEQLAWTAPSKSPVVDLEVDRSGRVLATYGDRSLWALDAESLESVGAYTRHSDGNRAVVAAPDGLHFATAGASSVKVWRHDRREPLRSFPWSGGEARHLAFDEGSRRLLATPPAGAHVTVWDVDENEATPVLHGHPSYVYALAVTPDGERLFSGSWHDDVRVWDARTAEALAVLPSKPGHVFALDVSPDGGRLLVYGYPNIVEVWSVHTGRRLAERNLGGRLWCRSAVFSSDGERVLITAPGRIHVLDAETLETLPSTLQCDAELRCRRLSDGRVLTSVSGETRVCRIDDGRVLASVALEVPLWALAAGPEERRAYLVDRDGEVHVWNLESGELERSFEGPAGRTYDLVTSPDGRRLFFAGADGIVHVWDPETGVKVTELAGHTSYVMQLAFTPDGTRLFSASGDGTVRVWSTEPNHVLSRVLSRRRRARARLEARVAGQVEALGSAAEVAEGLRADAALSELEREAALQVLLQLAAEDED